MASADMSRALPCCLAGPLRLLIGISAPVTPHSAPAAKGTVTTADSSSSSCSLHPSSSSSCCLHPEIERRYSVHELLGRGAQGDVYRARAMDDSKKQCALKYCIITEACQRESFLAECDAMKVLDHPNIAKLYGAFEGPSFFCFSIELCVGGSLADAISDTVRPCAQHGCDEADCRNLCRQMLAAIHYMHGMGFAHRDVKFENFCLMDRGVPLDKVQLKLIDFGFARRFRQLSAEGNGTEVTVRMKTECGTTGYTAPEVYLKAYDERRDIFSIGVMLFCMFACRMPFSGESPRDVMYKIQFSEPEWEPSEWTKACPDGTALVRKMLDKDPEERVTVEEALGGTWLAGMDQ